MEQKKTNAFVIVIAIIAATGGLLFGYDSGVISGALLYIKQDPVLLANGQEVMPERIQEWIVSIVLVGATLGAISSGRLTDLYGRKKIIFYTAIVNAVGTLLSALATSVSIMLLARGLVGLAIGVASYAVPLYISEISPARVRGTLVSLNQLAITLGILASYLVNIGFSDLPADWSAWGISEGWRWMLMIGFFPALILGIGMIFLPETPRWLMSANHESNAHRVLRKIGEVNPSKIVDEIKESLAKEEKAGWKELLAKWVRPALIIGIGIAILMQVTGINTVIYYSPTILQKAGFVAEGDAILAALPIGIVNVVFTIVALFLIDKWGRKPLLYLGLAGMAFALFVLGFSFLFHDTVGETLKWLSLGSMIIYIPFFALTLGPVGYVIMSEVFPTRVRGLGMSVALFFNWVANFVVANTFLSLASALTAEGNQITITGEPGPNPGGAFLVYAIIAIIGIVFVFRMVPETKGHSLEEIEQHFQEGKPPREL
ncbi:MAG: sugar porter family MFS transporter [Bacteroidota bacterium]